MIGDKNKRDRLLDYTMNELREIEKELNLAKNMLVEMKVKRVDRCIKEIEEEVFEPRNKPLFFLEDEDKEEEKIREDLKGVKDEMIEIKDIVMNDREQWKLRKEQ